MDPEFRGVTLEDHKSIKEKIENPTVWDRIEEFWLVLQLKHPTLVPIALGSILFVGLSEIGRLFTPPQYHDVLTIVCFGIATLVAVRRASANLEFLQWLHELEAPDDHDAPDDR